MQFFLPMIPPTVTAQQKRVNTRGKKPRFFDSPELAEARAKFLTHLVPHAPDVPLKPPVRLIVKWCFPRGKHADGEYRTSKPDTDNIQKAFKDSLERLGFVADDAHVASEIVEKFWAERPGIYVQMEEI